MARLVFRPPTARFGSQVRTTSLLALLLLAASTQSLAQHALTADGPLAPEVEGCNLCHGPHGAGSGGDNILRLGDTPGIGAQARGLGSASASCLRCHTTASVRASQPEFRGTGPGVSGGAYLELDLGNDHPLGLIDPGSLLAEPGVSAAIRPGLRGIDASALDVGGALEIGCTTCHDPHDRNGALPSPEAERVLCESCHDPSRYDYDRHAELACSSCHSVHAGHGNELFRQPSGDDVCQGCHGPGAVGAAASFEAMASRRARLYGASTPPMSPSGHLTPPDGRCVDCHPVHR